MPKTIIQKQVKVVDDRLKMTGDRSEVTDDRLEMSFGRLEVTDDRLVTAEVVDNVELAVDTVTQVEQAEAEFAQEGDVEMKESDMEKTITGEEQPNLQTQTVAGVPAPKKAAAPANDGEKDSINTGIFFFF